MNNGKPRLRIQPDRTKEYLEQAFGSGRIEEFEQVRFTNTEENVRDPASYSASGNLLVVFKKGAECNSGKYIEGYELPDQYLLTGIARDVATPELSSLGSPTNYMVFEDAHEVLRYIYEKETEEEKGLSEPDGVYACDDVDGFALIMVGQMAKYEQEGRVRLTVEDENGNPVKAFNFGEHERELIRRCCFKGVDEFNNVKTDFILRQPSIPGDHKERKPIGRIASVVKSKAEADFCLHTHEGKVYFALHSKPTPVRKNSKIESFPCPGIPYYYGDDKAHLTRIEFFAKEPLNADS